MKLPTIYVWTHDSIGLGEDGPTHQPIEHVAALRLIPGLDVVRPADANETSVYWRAIIEHTDRPAGLILSRQNLPVLDRGFDRYRPAEGAALGGYVLADADGELQIILIATGSEVHIALDARTQLHHAGKGTRVVSMPCVEWFTAQDEAYRNSILPRTVTARVSVEAGVATGWEKFIGDAGRSISVEHFGASADADTLYREFGVTADAVTDAALDILDTIDQKAPPGGHPTEATPSDGGTADRP